MGWDVVQIGLRHNLPVNDPIATAKEVAKRMKQNIRLVYRNEYEYDIEKNLVSDAEGRDLIELGKFEANNSGDYLQMIVSNYQAHQILELAGIEKLHKATFASGFAELILDDLEEPYELYEINGRNIYIRIFKENVDLDISVVERWWMWESAFHPSNPYREWLNNYRMQIYNRARMFGCNEVIICSDQGPTQMIYENMDYLADDLKEYARSFQYLKEDTWLDDYKKDEWKKHAKHILFSSFFQNQLILSDDDSVDVIFDDFSDIINSELKNSKEELDEHISQ